MQYGFLRVKKTFPDFRKISKSTTADGPCIFVFETLFREFLETNGVHQQLIQLIPDRQ